MRFDIVTLFPELFGPLLTSGITRRAFESGQVEVNLSNPRDFAAGNYKRVDDRPFGGGPGMVMMAEPLTQCLNSIQTQRADAAPVVLFSPAGKPLNHAMVERWAASAGAILICGRYEGLDQRFVDQHVTEQISLGDFVLSGGELAAMALMDAVIRQLPGVLNTDASAVEDSFVNGLLDSPHYTRPETYEGRTVPPVLIGGNHAEIEKWRRQRMLEATAQKRPDLLVKARAARLLSSVDEKFLSGL